MRYGLVTPYIGNTYSGAALIGLANVLEHAEPGQRILVVGYGSGAGSDAFDVLTTDALATFDRSFGTPVQTYLDTGVEISYSTYAKFRGKIQMGGS
jgi:hydroxymethylglutaryl-CoA synthase